MNTVFTFMSAVLFFINPAFSETLQPGVPADYYMGATHETKNPFYSLPHNHVKTGNAQHTTTFDKTGKMDVTPADDTGTEKDLDKFKPPVPRVISPPPNS